MKEKKLELAMVSLRLFKIQEFGMLNGKLLTKISKETGFTTGQLTMSMANFKNIHYNTGGMSHTSELQREVYKKYFKIL